LVFLRSVRRLLVAASVVSSSPILVTLMKEVLTRATRRNIPEDAILHFLDGINFISFVYSAARLVLYSGCTHGLRAERSEFNSRKGCSADDSPLKTNNTKTVAL
jgi:hypothetical protein